MIFEVRDLRFSYTSQRQILDRVSLCLEEGDILSVLGPNGAGKSTLMNVMTGLLTPASGQVLLYGRPLSSLKEKDIAVKVGYVPQQHAPTYGYTVFDFVLMGRAPLIPLFSRPGPADREAAQASLEQLHIGHLADQAYTEISGGERQLAVIARAIVRQPAVILFDEPTAHLDFGNQLRMLRVIKGLAQQGFAVMITTHNPDHALLLDGRTALLDREGHLRSGPTKEIVTEENMTQVYKAHMELHYVPELDRTVCIYPRL